MRRKKGFTLVEVIVVLVILGILAAILVPALLGWIDKARNQDAILECRSVVMAAQGKVAEIYAKNSGLDLEQEMNEVNNREDILKLAGTGQGTINANIKIGNSSNVSHLEYTTDKNINVLYDINNKPVYRIVDDFNQRGTNGQEHYDSLADKMKKEGLLDAELGTITDKLSDMINTADSNNQNASKVLQTYFKDNFGADGNYPKMTDTEKETLKGLIKGYESDKVKITNVSEFDKDIYWMPLVSKEGEVILLAQGGKVNAVGNAMASVIYYNGDYYCHYNGTNKIDPTYINDNKNDKQEVFSVQTNLLSDDRWLKVSK